MRKIGETSQAFRSYNTCQYGGRVFHFSHQSWKLTVTEAILGEGMEAAEVRTGVDLAGGIIGCCALGAGMLVMAGNTNSVSAALVNVGEGRLSAGTLQIAALAVSGDVEWRAGPYLCRVSEARALLYFCNQSSMWYCDVVGSGLAMRKLAAQMPTIGGFDSLPLHLSDGLLLVAGSYPTSTSITRIRCGETPLFERVGSIPGQARRWTSLALLGDRLAISFGGYAEASLDDLWVFDLQACRGSRVRKEGAWHHSDEDMPILIQGAHCYLIGGGDRKAVNSISLLALSDLVEDPAVRAAFKASLAPRGRPVGPGGPGGRPRPPAPSADELSRLKLGLAAEQAASRRLSDELAAAKGQASLVPGLQRDLQAARDEIAALRKENRRLREELSGSKSLPGAIQVHLPLGSPPALSLPRKLRIDPAERQKLRNAMDAHEKVLPAATPFAVAYHRAFEAFLGKELLRRILSLRSSVPERAARGAVVGHVFRLIPPGCLLPEGAGALALTRLHSLRFEEKFLDSELARRAGRLCREEVGVGRRVRERAPPAYHSAVALLEESDPLRAEAAHRSTGLLRRSARFSSEARRAGRPGTLAEAIRSLQRLERLKRWQDGEPRGGLPVPWLEAREKP